MRRLVRAVALAGLLAGGIGIVAQGVDVPSLCTLWPWLPGCSGDAAGGGSGGAG